jgi:hypothetical protein
MRRRGERSILDQPPMIAALENEVTASVNDGLDRCERTAILSELGRRPGSISPRGVPDPADPRLRPQQVSTPRESRSGSPEPCATESPPEQQPKARA